MKLTRDEAKALVPVLENEINALNNRYDLVLGAFARRKAHEALSEEDHLAQKSLEDSIKNSISRLQDLLGKAESKVRGESEEDPTHQRYWAVSAAVERYKDDGEWIATRQVPTFYLHPWVQGTLTEDQAKHVAQKVVDPFDDARAVHITVTKVD